MLLLPIGSAGLVCVGPNGQFSIYLLCGREDENIITLPAIARAAGGQWVSRRVAGDRQRGGRTPSVPGERVAGILITVIIGKFWPYWNATGSIAHGGSKRRTGHTRKIGDWRPIKDLLIGSKGAWGGDIIADIGYGQLKRDGTGT